MKPILTLVLAFLCSQAIAADKPNLIVILTDDHGWADLGAQGADAHIRTPNLAPHRQGFDEYFTGTMQDYSTSHALDGACL